MSLLQSNLSTFIVHYSPLSSRLRSQQESVAWQLLSPTLVTEQHCSSESISVPYLGDSSSLIRALIMAQTAQIVHILKLHSDSLSRGLNEIECAHLTPCSIDSDVPVVYDFFTQAVRAYSRKNHELSLQHIRAVKLFLQSGKEYALILEDDSLPVFNSLSWLQQALDSCLRSACRFGEGFFDISDSLGFRPKQSRSDNDSEPTFIAMGYGQTRCASAYLLTREVADFVVRQPEPIVLPIDWHLSYILSIGACPTFWSKRPIFVQGSQAGFFESNQASRNL